MKPRPPAFSLGEKHCQPTRLQLWASDGVDRRQLGQKHNERVTIDLMTRGSIQLSMGRWQTHSGHDYNPGKVTDMTTTPISALSPAAKRLRKPVLLKGQGRVNPQPSGHFGNQKRKHSPTHLLPECFPKLQEN